MSTRRELPPFSRKPPTTTISLPSADAATSVRGTGSGACVVQPPAAPASPTNAAPASTTMPASFIARSGLSGGAALPRRSHTKTEEALPGQSANASAEGASPERKAKRARDQSAALRWPGGCAGRLVVDEFEIDHVGRVTLAGTELDDARVAARTVGKARRNVREELVHDVLRAQRRNCASPRCEISAAAERDHLLGERLDRFGLRLRRLDPAVLDQRAAEVRDRSELVLGLRDEVTDRLDADALEAVVRPHAELELFDREVLHAVGERLRRARAVHRRRGDLAEALDLLDVGEDRELADQNLRSLRTRRLRIDRPVRRDVQAQLVVVRPLTDTRRFHVIRDAAHRREDRIDRDHSDCRVRAL